MMRNAEMFLLIFVCSIVTVAWARGEELLNEKWSDGSRAETNLPKEAAVWVGREADVTVKPGSLTTIMTPSSQKLWTYFTAKEPVTVDVGQTLTASVSFVPHGKLSDTTSRNLRIGVFHDPNDARVESDVNSDAGGESAPWRDARGYAVQVLLTGDEYTMTKPFDLGKRTNLENESLLGTSGDYTKVSGGRPVTVEIDKEYTVQLSLERTSKSEMDVSASIWQGDEELSKWSVFDDGSYLGPEGVYDSFDLLYVRLSDAATTANEIEFTNFQMNLDNATNKSN